MTHDMRERAVPNVLFAYRSRHPRGEPQLAEMFAVDRFPARSSEHIESPSTITSAGYDRAPSASARELANRFGSS